MPSLQGTSDHTPLGLGLARLALARLVLAVALLAVLAAALAPSAASAGRYHVYSCRTPSGEAAPSDGWKSSLGGDSVAANECRQGGALLVALRPSPGRLANTEAATWEWAPPAGELLVGATLWRAGDADGGGNGDATNTVWLAGPESGFAFDSCDFSLGCLTGVGNPAAPPLSEANRLRVSPANLGGRLFATATCRGLGSAACPETGIDAAGYVAALYLFGADLVLEQAVGPSVSGVAGELASAPSVSGASPISFAASDPGSGVYAVVFGVDGQVVQTTVPSENGGRCRDVGQTGDALHAFLYIQPCPASLSVQAALDTTRIANGTHQLAVSVQDAAGNSTPVLTRQLEVHNTGGPGPANGANANTQAALSVRWSTTARARITSPFGRSQTLHGRLTGPGGVPIAGASIDVSALPAFTGTRAAAMPSAQTDATGRFAVRLPAGLSSRTLRFAYRAHLGDQQPAAATRLVLNVRAGLGLRVSPADVAAGGSIRFRGRLRGGPVPREGKQVVLEARAPGSGWIQFDDVRSDARGRFRASYRFKFPGPAHYQFRAVSEPQSDYPYARGASNVVGVYERP